MSERNTADIIQLRKNEDNSVVLDRIGNALKYIKELEDLAKKPIFAVNDHGRTYFWEHQVESLPGVETNIEEGWLLVPRLQPGDPPPWPVELDGFVRVKTRPDITPTLDEEELEEFLYDEESEESVRAREEKVALIRRIYEKYLESWTAWSEIEIPRRKTISFYEKLFSIHRMLLADSASDPVELVWGVGIGILRTNQATVRYPVLTQLCETELDKDSMSLIIRPRDMDLVIEIGPYLALDFETALDAKKSAEDFLKNTEKGFNPFDVTSFEGALKAFASVVDSRGIYWPDKDTEGTLTTLPTAEENLKVTDTWALFVRPRSAHFLSQDIEELLGQLDQGVMPGPAVETIFNDPDHTPPEFKTISWRGVSSPVASGSEVKELYFPKPYNEDQVRIIERLEQAPGVVAQGPPGTGKSHTIANITSHYLAQGKRILISSKGEQALEVLKQHLPESIRPLAISLLSNDRASLKEMEASIESISARIQQENPTALDAKIKRNREEIDNLCSDIARIETEMKEWARKQLSEVPYAERKVKPEELAKLLVEEAPRHEWFPGELESSESDPQFEQSEVEELRAARRLVGRDLEDLSWTLPSLHETPSIQEIGALHAELSHKQSMQVIASSEGLPKVFGDYSQEGIELCNKSLDVLKQAHDIATLHGHSEKGWMTSLWRRIKSQPSKEGQSDSAVEALKTFAESASVLGEERGPFVASPVDLAREKIDEKIKQAIGRLGKGEAAFGFISGIGKGSVKKAIAEIKVSGRTPNNEEEWLHVAEYIHFGEKVDEASARWSSFREEFNFKELSAEKKLDLARQIGIVCRDILDMFDFVASGWPLLKGNFSRVFPGSGGASGLLATPPDILRYIAALENHLGQAGFTGATAKLGEYTRLFGRHNNDLADKAHTILKRLGDPEIPRDSIEAEWDELRTWIGRLESYADAANTIKDVTYKINKSGAKSWAHELQTKEVSGDLDPLLPSTWRQSLEWVRKMKFLDEIDGRERLSRLASMYRQKERSLARKNEEIVETLIWRQLADMSPAHRRALVQYSTAVRRIGKGTGKKKAPKYRREAREAMQEAVGAVPCWIMPTWRVSETLPSQFGCFDLVIIDEASQSDIRALPAIIRGKKVLIVGDDKQVSPVSVGKTHDSVARLADKYLGGFDLGKRMTLEDSIYDLARVAFAADNICLREHFRCTEPIIQFSNRLCYNNQIVPLRIPTASERIDPPLVDVYVKDGYRDSTGKINRPEAKAIAKEIEVIVNNPAYEGRTIGVVTLLGQNQQSKLINEYLFDMVGEEAIIDHDIVCGEPGVFQGSEKDIMFLSLVDDSSSLTAKTSSMWEQRYNVAVSRARDRMYLFRSFTRNDIRNQECLRGKLLDHFRNPMLDNKEKVDSLRDLCESDFELRVYDALVDRGYRVTPQVKAGPYRIDMVVEGGEDLRLAIECDGDAFHGPDSFSEDMMRQRVLERAGWTFWRCWGSSFYRETEECLADLYETLETMGITPSVGGEEIQRQYVDYREVCGESTLDVEGESGTNVEPEDDFSENVANFESSEPEFSEDTALVPQEAEVTPTPTEEEYVEVGDTVKYYFDNEEENVRCVQISDRISEPKMGIIGFKTPLAVALLEARASDEIEVLLPSGCRQAMIVEIIKGGME